MMRTNLLLFFACMLAASGLPAQQASIVGIDAAVAGMKQSMAAYREDVKLSTAEGSRQVYYDGDELKVVVVKAVGKVEKQVAWYYADQKMIYTETSWTNAATGESLFSEKTYHDKNGLMAWLNSESTFVDTSSDEFKAYDKALTAYGIKIMQAALEE